jgi:hypothetical protein
MLDSQENSMDSLTNIEDVEKMRSRIGRITGFMLLSDSMRNPSCIDANYIKCKQCPPHRLQFHSNTKGFGVHSVHIIQCCCRWCIGK